MDFTANWLWPQWTMAIIIIVRLIIFSSAHGKERVETTGERKGRPQRYSAFAAFINAGLLISILICGGFFR